VSSGAGTLSWLMFLPVSVLFGQLTRGHGVQSAGLLLAVLALAVAGLLARTTIRSRSAGAPATPTSTTEAEIDPAPAAVLVAG
jgi:hypothetical protein